LDRYGLRMNALQKIRQTVNEIQASPDSPKSAEGWALVGRLLGRMPCDQGEVSRVCRERDVGGLGALVDGLEHPRPRAAPSEGALPSEAVSQKDKIAAMRAYRKRLKLARLDEESKIGNRQLTGGHKSEIDAIIPPNEFSRAVWDALVADGELKNTGQGFYQLA
jgi:hypothetical protein